MDKPSKEFRRWAYSYYINTIKTNEFEGDVELFGIVDYMWLAYLKGREDSKVEIERLRKAIKTHRANVGGDSEVQHIEDIELYAVLEKKV
jgi:hypothetical protein